MFMKSSRFKPMVVEVRREVEEFCLDQRSG